MSDGDQERDAISARAMAILAASAFVIGGALSVLWLSTRVLLSLGGGSFSLGPGSVSGFAYAAYATPASIVALVIAMQTSKGLSDRYDTPSLMLLSWAALFLTLASSFIAYGITPTPGAVGLLIAGITFVVMGLGGLYVFVVSYRTGWKMDREKAEQTGALDVRPGFLVYQVANALALACGAAAGWWLTRLLGF